MADFGEIAFAIGLPLLVILFGVRYYLFFKQAAASDRQEKAELTTHDMSLHEACFDGNARLVKAHVNAGADVNAPAASSDPKWPSCAEGPAKPLNCIAIASPTKQAHVRIARALIQRGATVDQSVIDDARNTKGSGEAKKALNDLLMVGL